MRPEKPTAKAGGCGGLFVSRTIFALSLLPSVASAKVGVLSKESKERESMFAFFFPPTVVVFSPVLWAGVQSDDTQQDRETALSLR